MDIQGAKCLWFHEGPACVSSLHLCQTCAGYSWSYLCAGAGRCPECQGWQLKHVVAAKDGAQILVWHLS